jgi:hypothetical protein
MRNALKGIVVGVFVLALVGAIATRLGWISASPPRPHGEARGCSREQRACSRTRRSASMSS